MRKKKICVNIGHHQNSQGAKSILDYFEWSEYKFNSILARKILEKSKEKNHILSNYNIAIVRQGKYNELPELVNDTRSDICISLHLNSWNTNTATGSEVLYLKNSYKGKELAKHILNPLTSFLRLKNRGIKEKDKGDRGWHLLRYTDMPCVIIEPGFISNQSDLETLISFLYANTRYSLADVIAIGIKGYFRHND